MVLLFVGVNMAHESRIGKFVGHEGGFIFGYAVYGVCSGNAALYSLCEAAKSIGKGLLPDVFGRSFDQVTEFRERPSDWTSHFVCLRLIKKHGRTSYIDRISVGCW